MAAGCNMAAGLAGSNHSHLAVHTAVASAAVGTASLPGPLEPGPACQGDTAVRLGVRRHLLGMGCSAAAANGGECPSHTTEVSSSPLGPSDCPEPNRAQRGVREPSEPEQLLSASLRGLLRTRKTRTGLGPRRRRRAHARPPARPARFALPRPAWRGGPGLGERKGGTGCRRSGPEAVQSPRASGLPANPRPYVCFHV